MRSYDEQSCLKFGAVSEIILESSWQVISHLSYHVLEREIAIYNIYFIERSETQLETYENTTNL